MNRTAILACLWTLTGGAALAQAPATTAPMANPSSPAMPVPASPAVRGTDSDAGAARLAKVALMQAVTTAEGQGSGGRAIDAEFQRADGNDPVHYSVKVVYPDGKLVEYGINADSGQLYKTENQPIERYFTRLKPADFQGARTSLKDALAIAERHAGGGKAYEAEVEREGSTVQYDIKVALADREQTVWVKADGMVVN